MNKSRKALLVEDDPFMRLAVVDFLTDHGFCVTAVSTYTEAVQAAIQAGENKYQLAILDISLPYSSDEDMSVRKPLGIDLCRRLKQHNPNCGIILWSAYSHYLPEVTQFVAEGVTGLAYLLKGSRMTTLLELISQVLQGEVKLMVRPDNSYDEEIENRFISSLPPDLVEIIVEVTRRLPLLTIRQCQVLSLLPRNPQAIAQELGLAVATVRNYIDAAYTRLGLRDGDFDTQPYRREAIIVLAFVLKKLQRRQRL